MKDNLICKIFGHSWKYFFLKEDGRPKIDVRVCTRCHRIQHWKYLTYPYNKFVWMNVVGYTELGAKEHVTGYNKDME